MLINYADPTKNPLSTSSHTRQSVEVILVDAAESKVLSVTGFTWSLMNFNSASKLWRYTETPAIYIQRKKTQLAKILQLIRTNKKLDFILLQDVDILTSQSHLSSMSDIKACQELLSEFIANLNKLGWYLSTTDHQQKSLATLFNGRTLHPVANKLILNGCGFESEFTHAATRLPVVLVNLQLTNDQDYLQLILQYQASQIAANKFTIMGGDTAHCDLPGLVNTGNHITQLTANMNGQSRCYDCFLASPTQQSRLIIIERAAEAFALDNTVNEYIIRDFIPNIEYRTQYIHQGVTGKPYEKTGWVQLSKPKVEKKPVSEAIKQVESTVIKTKTTTSGHLTVYRNDDGDFIVEFPTANMRDKFLRHLGGSKALPENVEGKYSRQASPIVMPEQNKQLYFPATGNDKRIEIAFADREAAIQFNQLIFGDTDLSHYHRVRPAVIVRGEFAANHQIDISINEQLQEIVNSHTTSLKK